MRIDGAVAIVTGAASGIGYATASRLASRGATVVAADVRAEALNEAVDRLRARWPGVDPAVADVSSRIDAERLVLEAAERHGRVDIVANVAAIGLRKRAQDTSVDEIERVIATNFLGPVYTTMAALPGMVQRRSGFVVNVSSVAGTLPNPMESAYNGSKAALLQWTHTLSIDLRGTGVRAGVLVPGPIDTRMWKTLDNAAAYRGRLYPPEVPADALVDMIEHDREHVTAPRRYALPGIMNAIFGGAMRRSIAAYEDRAARRRGAR
jgi:NAD(P)-dependent dehydrogenase (short-subunit alcohol dehydrogenase family)